MTLKAEEKKEKTQGKMKKETILRRG